MDRLQDHLDRFQDHLLESGYSKAASKNYRFRAATFLRRCPEVLEADESRAKELVEAYIAELPRNTARTIPAAAVRRWWVFRFDRPYRDRITPSQVEAGESIAAELTEFEGYLRTFGNIQ